MKFKQLPFLGLIFFVLGACAYAQDKEVAKLESTTQSILDFFYSEAYKDHTNEEKEVKVRAALEKNYDFTFIIRRTVGRNWKLLSSQEQSQVKDLVTKLIVKSFVEGIQGLERPVVKYGKMTRITDKRIEVPSVIHFPGGKVFNLKYRLGLTKSGWQIYDILAEDVSVVSNYRQQFDDHFRKGSGAELIVKLKKLLEEENPDQSDGL